MATDHAVDSAPPSSNPRVGTWGTQFHRPFIWHHILRPIFGHAQNLLFMGLRLRSFVHSWNFTGPPCEARREDK